MRPCGSGPQRSQPQGAPTGAVPRLSGSEAKGQTRHSLMGNARPMRRASACASL
jgi:hypothetical protein